MKQIAISIILILSFCGCISEPKLESTKPWENHYYSTDEIKNIIQTIQLDKNESIWMISNHTLNRLLKNVGK